MLAGEANAPGAFAKRTVNLLADLDKEDAILFTKLCGFGWMIGNVCPLVFDPQASVYDDQGVNFNSLSHLESLSLIQFNHIAGFKRLRIPKVETVFYYGQSVTLKFPNDFDNELEIGRVLLTRAGQQLAPVCAPTAVDGYFQYMKEKWFAQSLIQSQRPNPTFKPTAPLRLN